MALFLAAACAVALVTLDASGAPPRDVPPARVISDGPRPGGVVAPSKRRWLRGRIPYSFAPDVPELERARVDSAIAQIHARAFGVTFEPRTNERDYVLFRPADDCSSEAEGREGGRSVVWLSGTCLKSGVLHELLHVLGFRHEQNRCDRDKYISIIWSNIEPTKIARHQFEKRCGVSRDLEEYDEASIMHYTDTAFGVKRDADGALLKTIVSRRGRGSLMGQRDSLSTIDIRTINMMYPPQAPAVAVSYPGGSPTLSWDDSRAALSYSVHLVVVYTEHEESGHATVREATAGAEGSTTGLSFVDLQNSYTGQSHCEGYRFSADHYYEVRALYADGVVRSGTRVPAMVAPEVPC